MCDSGCVSRSTRNKKVYDAAREIFTCGVLMEIAADGDCFFTSLALFPDSDANSVREQICQHIQVSDPLDLDNHIFLGSTRETHLAKMKQSGTWATALEVRAAESVFNLSIMIHTVSTEGKVQQHRLSDAIRPRTVHLALYNYGNPSSAEGCNHYALLYVQGARIMRSSQVRYKAMNTFRWPDNNKRKRNGTVDDPINLEDDNADNHVKTTLCFVSMLQYAGPSSSIGNAQSRESVNLTQADVQRLEPKEWLNDNLVNFYLKYLHLELCASQNFLVKQVGVGTA